MGATYAWWTWYIITWSWGLQKFFKAHLKAFIACHHQEQHVVCSETMSKENCKNPFAWYRAALSRLGLSALPEWRQGRHPTALWMDILMESYNLETWHKSDWKLKYDCPTLSIRMAAVNLKRLQRKERRKGGNEGITEVHSFPRKDEKLVTSVDSSTAMTIFLGPPDEARGSCFERASSDCRTTATVQGALCRT